MRERWDSRRSLEHHHITLQTSYWGVNDSSPAMRYNMMILHGYIYFRLSIMDRMMPRDLFLLPQDKGHCLSNTGPLVRAGQTSIHGRLDETLPSSGPGPVVWQEPPE